MSGKLYLCATPIGNLEDMTYRVVRTLGEVDLIAAEDTRNSVKLLNHFGIKTPMTSYHEYNKIEKGKKLIEKLKDGMQIALVTDAGTPGVSDPGEELVKMCYEEGIESHIPAWSSGVYYGIDVVRDFRQEDLRLRHFCRQIKKKNGLY